MGLTRNQWVFGSDYSFSRWVPSQFSIAESNDEDHEGTVSIHALNPFVIYGISNGLNLVLKTPFIHWSQTADEPDAHHRTESMNGFGDMSIGARWLVINRFFGPGHRLFLEADLTLPTGNSYETNPFANDADSVEHRHFAMGDGVTSTTVAFQWWYRSEFPWIGGITGQVQFPWAKSDLGFLPGKSILLSLHAIRQSPLFPRAYPYLRLRIQREEQDRWKGEGAPNSGGSLLAVMAGLDLEITESLAGVVSIELPVWRRFEGSQLDPLTFSLSLRRLGHWHGSQ